MNFKKLKYPVERRVYNAVALKENDKEQQALIKKLKLSIIELKDKSKVVFIPSIMNYNEYIQSSRELTFDYNVEKYGINSPQVKTFYDKLKQVNKTDGGLYNHLGKQLYSSEEFKQYISKKQETPKETPKETKQETPKETKQETKNE